jgi:uncharacterized protein YoxC
VNTYETFVVIGMAMWLLVSVGLLAFLVYLAVLLRKVRQPLERVAAAAQHLEHDLQPLLHSVERSSEDVQHIVSSLRNDVSEVGRTMRKASESTGAMLDLVEERVVDMAALMEVVQEEAEETFFSTASLLRGLRAGRRASKSGPVKRLMRGLGRTG